MQNELRVSHCYYSFVGEQGHPRAIGKYDAPSVRAFQSCSLHGVGTLRHPKFLWCSGNQQDSLGSLDPFLLRLYELQAGSSATMRKEVSTFETWVSVQDVVLNKLRDRPRNQVNRSQSSATFTTTHKRRVSSCRYGSCWCVTSRKQMGSCQLASFSQLHKSDQKHVVTKSLYLKTWFGCLNKFKCLKNVETFQACLPQICYATNSNPYCVLRAIKVLKEDEKYIVVGFRHLQ